MAILFITTSCNSANDTAPTQSVKKEEVKGEGNSLVKGRYQCWRLSTAGNEIASDLHILSDTKYKIDDLTGNYSYDPGTGIIQWLDGPLHQSTENWVGVFTRKGTSTGKGGRVVNSIIEIRRKADMDAGNLRTLQQCDCAKKE